jgi:hypothetical protein
MTDYPFPVVDVPEPVDEVGLYDRRYRPSVLWDWKSGDFARDGANKLVACDGMEAFRTWCMKTVDTERYACAAYDRSIGTEITAAQKEKTHAAARNAIERTITEALLVNPRTEYVRDFAFESAGDQAWVSFTVKGIDWEEFRLRTSLEGGVASG